MIAELNIPAPALNEEAGTMLFHSGAFTRWQSVSVDGKHTDVLVVRVEVTREDDAVNLAHLLCAQLGIDAAAVYLPMFDYGKWVGPKAGGRVFDINAFVPYVVAQAQHH